jgi:adenylate kinase
MILFYGAPGSGKSVQGQMMAARHDCRWLSAGALLRDSRDKAVLEKMHSGEFVPDEIVNKAVGEAIGRSASVEHVILDGYPRHLEQAEWLVGELPKHERSINAVVVLEVPTAEIMRRLRIRGRADDSPEAVSKRMADYQQTADQILEHYRALGIPVEIVDGVGSVGEVHDEFMRLYKNVYPCKN